MMQVQTLSVGMWIRFKYHDKERCGKIIDAVYNKVSSRRDGWVVRTANGPRTFKFNKIYDLRIES